MTMRGVRLLRRSFQVQTLKRASPSYSSTFIGSRLWNYGSKLQTRRAITSITETKDETVVLEEQDKALASNTATDEDEEDSQEVWVERLKEALRKHESVSLENDKTAWIQSVETVRDCYLHLGSFADALTMEQQLLDVVDAYQDQADSLHRMGSLHLQLQHFDKAKRYYQAALDKFYTIHGHESFHKDMGKLLIGLGGICVHSGNPDQALPYLAQAEEHYRNHGISRHDTEQPDPHPEVTTVLANQAVVHRMLGQHQVAIDKYQEIMAFVEEENAPNKDVKRDELQFQIADCLFTLNQLSPALDHFETLLDNEIVRRGQEESSHEGVLRHFIGVIHCKQVRSAKLCCLYEVSLPVQRLLTVLTFTRTQPKCTGPNGGSLATA